MTTIEYLTSEQIDKQIAEIQKDRNKIEELQGQLIPVLEQFQKAYVNYYESPQNEEYERTFQHAIQYMQGLNTKLFSIQNTVLQNTKILNQQMMEMNEMIEKEKKQNDYLNKKYDNTNSKQQGSIEMVDEFKEIYNENYQYNATLFLGLLISIYITVAMFARKNT